MQQNLFSHRLRAFALVQEAGGVALAGRDAPIHLAPFKEEEADTNGREEIQDDGYVIHSRVHVRRLEPTPRRAGNIPPNPGVT